MRTSTSSIWHRSGVSEAMFLLAFLSGCSSPTPPDTIAATVVNEPEVSNRHSLDGAAETGAIAEATQKTERESKNKPQPPLHVEEVVQRIDLRKFPFMEGNARASATIDHYGFSAPVSEKFSIDGVMSYLDKLLLDANCVRGTDPSLEMQDVTGAMRLYWHGDLMITASCGISRGSTGPDINSGIHVEGNFDLRVLPTPPNAASIASKPNSLRLKSSSEILELRKFYSTALRELGWLEFRDYLPGVDVPVESQLPHQSFLKNGVFINFFHYTPKKDPSNKSEVETNVRTGILGYEPTLPNDARSVKIRQSSPVAMAYETELTPYEVRSFYDNAYLALGYRCDKNTTAKEDQDFASTYSHPNKVSLRIEAKRLGKSSIVVANEIK